MRCLVPWFVSAGTGAVVAMVGVLASYWWAHRDDTADFGFYSYSPLSNGSTPRRYVDYLPVSGGTDWIALLVPAAVAGALLGVVVLIVVRFGVRRSPRQVARS